jgi:signal transduction histidine kinase
MGDREIQFKRNINILIIEDNQVDRRILHSMLSKTITPESIIKATDSLTTAENLLDEHAFDVVILDLNLPDSKGKRSLDYLNEKCPKTAIVINTGAYDEDLGLETLRQGAQDFLVKGKYSSYILNKTLHYAIERKRLELDLKETNAQLKETRNQLIQAEKLKVIGGLASGVAHEVRNPLATILYGVTYLTKQVQVDDEKYTLVLDNIREATTKANTIITDLLDFSSLAELKKESGDLNTVVEKALLLTNHEINKHKVHVCKDLAQDIPKLEFDKNRIEQVLINLFINAIYAMADDHFPEAEKGKREKEITVLTRVQTLSNDLEEIPLLYRKHFQPHQKVAAVCVKDTGTGIPPETIDKIFDPFFTSRRARGGVGLGLSVCQNIMQIHKGCITIRNREQQGAVATLIFQL